MIELSFADGNTVRSSSRPFDCSVCLRVNQATSKLRRCKIDRWDFTSDDNPSVFPISITKGSAQYGFCPAKATWDVRANQVFRMLVLSAETGNLYVSGGIAEQPNWFVELASWFVPLYDSNKFMSRVKQVLGDDKKAPQVAKHGNRKR